MTVTKGFGGQSYQVKIPADSTIRTLGALIPDLALMMAGHTVKVVTIVNDPLLSSNTLYAGRDGSAPFPLAVSGFRDFWRIDNVSRIGLTALGATGVVADIDISDCEMACECRK